MEYEIKWWSEWLKAEMLDRMEMVEKLSFIKDLKFKKRGLNSEQTKKMISMMINSFFEDLESAIITKQRIELGGKKR